MTDSRPTGRFSVVTKQKAPVPSAITAARAARGWCSYKTSLVEGPAPNVRPSVVWPLPTTPPGLAVLSTLIARLRPGR